MPHLIEPLRSVSLVDALTQLTAAHDFLVERSRHHSQSLALHQSETQSVNWGIHNKRLPVSLEAVDRPPLIGKDREWFTEIINIVATVERLISALRWFNANESYKQMMISCCHPSTSASKNENDLVLFTSSNPTIIVKCEVSDVTSGHHDGNAKEIKDLKSLGCETDVPEDGTIRFICTSEEFADFIVKRSQHKIPPAHYCYEEFPTNDGSGTVMLLVLPNSAQP